ncbi:hypothetical protein [Rhodopila sp.]|uniref:hypothetical protein n=1 Tax=Rhodopila sp. TaxID=2480087 RepID=UPI002CD9E10A|nr:hypothetical protein [Rhodopila sp.]HVZ08187.1 hypothetical protein [Rhodopila sp.]
MWRELKRRRELGKGGADDHTRTDLRGTARFKATPLSREVRQKVTTVEAIVPPGAAWWKTPTAKRREGKVPNA